MANPILLAGGFLNPVALRVAASSNRIVVAQRDGKFITVDATTAQTTQLATMPGRVATFDLAADGKTAFVAVERDVWEADLSTPSTRRLVRGMALPRAILFEQTGGPLLVAEGNSPGRVFSINPSSSPLQATQIGRGLSGARAMVHNASSGRIIIAAQSDGGSLVEPVAGARPTVIRTGLGSPLDLAWTDQAQEQLIVADTAGSRILLVDLSQPGDPPTELYTGIGKLWGARLLANGRLVIGAGDSLLLGDFLRPQVELRPLSGKLFIGGWTHVRVRINDPAIAFDDLEFSVDPAASGAMVSYARDNSFDPTRPTIMLTVGVTTGSHELIAIHRPTGNKLGTVKFDVLANWTDEKLGPSFTVVGSVRSGPSGGTWGGADSGDFHVPQNVAVNKAVGERKIGVVLVDTASARYPTGAALQTIINNLRDEIVNGVGGQNRSVLRYYHEASNGLLTLDLVGIVGPISLLGDWTSYFALDPGGSGQWIANTGWPATVIAEIVAQNTAAVAAGGAPILDLSHMDSIIHVVRSVVAVPPAMDQFVWARAATAPETQLIGTTQLPGGLSMPTPRGIAWVNMPDDWAVARGGGRQFHETLAHELGHNLGLIDQYDRPLVFSADATSRITGGWELMSLETNLPLPSAAHRLMLGWIAPKKVKLYNFGVFGQVDEPITLHAASEGAAPDGRWAAAEVRLEDGKNYYFEYRPSTAGRIVDPTPP